MKESCWKIYTKRILIFLAIIYLLFSFEIRRDKKNVYFRIWPGEKISYWTIPSKLKKAYKEFKPEIKKQRIDFSDEKILFTCKNKIYKAELKDDNATVGLFIPEYKYSVSDTFDLFIYGDDYKYADTIRYSIVDGEKEIKSWYFRILNHEEFFIPPAHIEIITSLLKNNPTARFVITECIFS